MYRTKKIKLFLKANDEHGGIYQYSQSLLDAFISLPSDKYSKSIVISNIKWLRLIPPDAGIAIEHIYRNHPKSFAEGRYNPLGIISRKLRKCFKNIKVPEEDDCDLRIYPNINTVSDSITNALVCVHDLMHRYEQNFPEVSERAIYEQREIHYRKVCDYASGIIVDSELGKIHLVESYLGVNKDKIFVLPYISRKSLFDEVNVDIVKKKYSLPDKFLFYPAKFWTHKNHVGLINAIAIVKKRNSDVQLILTGEKSNSYDEAMRLIEYYGLRESIKCIGKISDLELNAVYKLARGMIMPSFFGPTNLPPLEAMALGCPCAVSNVYGMAAQIGNAGLLFDPKSPAEIASKIEMLWRDDIMCKKMIENGLLRTKKYFTRDIFNSNFQRIVEKLLETDENN